MNIYQKNETTNITKKIQVPSLFKNRKQNHHLSIDMNYKYISKNNIL